jgi:polysaccharide biosynthesis transport protein
MTSDARVDLASFLRVIRRRRWLIVGTAVAAALLALGFSLLQEDRYEAEASLLFQAAQAPPRIDPNEPPPDVPESPERAAATNLAIASLEVVTVRAKQRLDSPLSVKELRDRVSFEPAGQADIVTVKASGRTPEGAARLANVFAAEVVRFRTERARAQVQRVIDAIETQLATVPPKGGLAAQLTRRAEQLEVEKRLQSGDVEIAEQAVPPLDRAAPKPVRNTIIGGGLGLLMGVLLALGVQRLDRRVDSEAELAELLGAPIVGRIPVESDSDWGRELYRESFRFLSANLQAVVNVEEPPVVAVTGATPGVGKSSVVARLSEALASTGARVIAVDCDLRRPKLHQYFNVSGERGLADALAENRNVATWFHETAPSLLQDGPGGVRVLAAGTSRDGPPIMAATPSAVGEIISTMRHFADWTIVDTAPVTIEAVTSSVAANATGVLLVVDLKEADRDVVVAAADQLRTAGSWIIGVAINRAPSLLPADDYRSYYGASARLAAASGQQAQDNGRPRRSVRLWPSRSASKARAPDSDRD